MSSFLKFSLGGFEADVGQFVALVRDLAAAQLDSQTKEALRTLIAEARRSFDVVVDVVTPLYAVNSAASLQTAFPPLCANFKNSYFKQAGEVRTHCHIVTGQIQALKGSKAWRENIPLFRNAYDRLARSSDEWIGNDNALAYKMESFLNEMDAELNAINTALRSDADGAYRAAAALVSETDAEIKNIKLQLNDLREISSRLAP